MTDTRTDLPSREEVLFRVVPAVCDANSDVSLCRYPNCFCESGGHNAASAALDALTLLDLAAEMQRRGAEVDVLYHDVDATIWTMHFRTPQQEDTAE